MPSLRRNIDWIKPRCQNDQNKELSDAVSHFRCPFCKLWSVPDRSIHPPVAAEVLLLTEGHMIKYKKLGFKSLEEYTEHFFATLLPSNKTYEYFVD